MIIEDLKTIIAQGETSRVQFKANLTSPDALAAEFCAFANTLGGTLLIGVEDKTGAIIGLTQDDIRKTNNLLSNVAGNNITPPVSIITEILTPDAKAVVVVCIQEGLDKPYTDNKGIVWVKNGADKRRVTDKNEYARLLQQSRNLFADEMPVQDALPAEIDSAELDNYFRLQYETPVADFITLHHLTFEKLIANMHLSTGSFLNLAGLLLFGKAPELYKPAFVIKAVSFFGNDTTDAVYRDSEDIAGNIGRQFKNGMAFLMRNLKKLQKEQGFNSIGIPEISKTALEELLQNALVHRDYFRNAPVRIFIFDDRVEIISPGRLSNNLTVENIILGNTVIRNNIIASFASRLLPYRGLGTGIRRALKEEPGIRLFNDPEGEQFIVTIPRPGSAEA